MCVCEVCGCGCVRCVDVCVRGVCRCVDACGVWMCVSEVHVCGFVFVWSMSGGGCEWSMYRYMYVHVCGYVNLRVWYMCVRCARCDEGVGVEGTCKYVCSMCVWMTVSTAGEDYSPSCPSHTQ